MVSRNAIHLGDVITLQEGILATWNSWWFRRTPLNRSEKILQAPGQPPLPAQAAWPFSSSLLCHLSPVEAETTAHPCSPLNKAFVSSIESLQCHWQKLPEPKQCLQKLLSKLECHIPLNRSGANKKIPLQFHSCIAIFSYGYKCIHHINTKNICKLPTYYTHDNFKCVRHSRQKRFWLQTNQNLNSLQLLHNLHLSSVLAS